MRTDRIDRVDHVDRIQRTVALTVLAVLCAACTVGPEMRQPEISVPPEWAAQGARAFDAGLPSHAVSRPLDSAAWWAAFADPTLDRLVQLAATQNLDVQTAVLRIEESRTQRDSVAGRRYPTVAGSVIAGRARLSENGGLQSLAGGGTSSGGGSGGGGGGSGSGSGGSSSATPAPAFNLFQLGFDATWELDLFGGTRRSIEAAEANVRSAEEARHDALVSLTAEIAKNWFGLRGARQQREIALADIATQEELRRLVGSRNRAGLIASGDLVTQQVAVDAARAQLPPTEQSIAQFTNRIGLLLALPPGGAAELLGEPAAMPPLPPEVPIGLPGDLLRRRPDIRQREADLAAATAQVGVATAQLFPRVTLGASAGLQSSRTSNLLEWSSRFLLGGAQVSIPIFQGGQVRAQVRVADLQAQRAVISYRQTVLNAFYEVDNALVSYATEQRRAESLRGQLQGAHRSRELALERYRNGLAAYFEVLDAERQAHQAALAVAESTVNASSDLAALYKALGGGWDDREQVAAR